MVDFLINYEHKVREIESVCLLKIELERRGYSVELYCTYAKNRYHPFRKKRKAKVVLSSALYESDSIPFFVYDLVGFCKKIVNLQWEQVIWNQDEADTNAYQNPKGFSREALHFCWSEESRNRLAKAGVHENKTSVVGPIQMDLLDKKFRTYYLNKKDISFKFQLVEKSEWVLFISSYTYVNMSAEEYDAEIKRCGLKLNEFQKLSILSKNETISWIEEAVKTFKDKTFIYRPHPSENSDVLLNNLQNKYPNFKVIKELSAKQWILVCQKVLTWYSTCIAEAFFANKNCSIIRPLPIPYCWDVPIYNNAKYITTLDDFIQDLSTKDDNQFPISSDVILKYYDIQPSKHSFIRACDVLEEVINTTKFDMQKHENKISILFKNYKFRILFLLKNLLLKTNFPFVLFKNKYLISKVEKHRDVLLRLDQNREKSEATVEEIQLIEESLKKIIVEL